MQDSRWALTRTEQSRVEQSRAEQRGRIPSLDLLDTLLLMQPRTGKENFQKKREERPRTVHHRRESKLS